MMEVALPVAAASMDCYEDMFKEITRKLYGEEGLPDIESAGGVVTDYDGDGDGHGGTLTAFGLAALMQNGFPHHPHAEDRWVSSEEVLQWTGSKIASYNPAQKLFRCCDCECVGFLARVAEHWLGTHANLRVFQCPQCPYSSAWARCVRMHLTRQHNLTEESSGAAMLYKENPVLEEVTKFLQRLKNKVETTPPPSKPPPPPPPDYQARSAGPDGGSGGGGGGKRYCCTYCPYATDRRDLFTRHENIHREEKPFQCYVCQKQFNRADHVKKHFLRMHRDYPYDLNRIRRQPPKNASGMSYYHKYNNNTSHAPHQSVMAPPVPQLQTAHAHSHGALNIPAGFSAMAAARSNAAKPGKLGAHGHNGCNARSHGSKSGKKKGEKRYSCCYCAWSGVDNWCLKRHLNTHLKPFVCVLCDYKAARAERLATHVLKVHNKRACSRCAFLADDPSQLAAHLQEHHPLEHRNSHFSSNSLRNMGIATPPPSLTGPFGHQGGAGGVFGPMVKREHFDVGPPSGQEPFAKARQHYGAARLFHYMEASDTSEPEESERECTEDEDPPPFVCRDCGCEFVDDISLETHVQQHRPLPPAVVRPPPYQCSVCGQGLAAQTAMMEHMRTHSGLLSRCRADHCHFSTPLGADALREHVAATHGSGRCPHCGLEAETADALRHHQSQHHAADAACDPCERIRAVCDHKLCGDSSGATDSNMNHADGPKRSRKQSQPRRVLPEPEIRVLRRHPRRARGRSWRWRLAAKHAGRLLVRRARRCNWCRQEALPYHSPASLALHNAWRHTCPAFPCEHCELSFRHRYQVVLHASRLHVTTSQPITTVPQPMKEPIFLNTPVPAPSEPSFSNIHVPESIHINKPVHKDVPSPALEESSMLNTPLPPPSCPS